MCNSVHRDLPSKARNTSRQHPFLLFSSGAANTCLISLTYLHRLATTSNLTHHGVEALPSPHALPPPHPLHLCDLPQRRRGPDPSISCISLPTLQRPTCEPPRPQPLLLQPTRDRSEGSGIPLLHLQRLHLLPHQLPAHHPPSAPPPRSQLAHRSRHAQIHRRSRLWREVWPQCLLDVRAAVPAGAAAGAGDC